jgi:ribosomal protein L37E
MSVVVSVLFMCVVCVLRGVCQDDDVCRFRRCRRCGAPMDYWGDRWVQCSLCGFTNVHSKLRVERL